MTNPTLSRSAHLDDAALDGVAGGGKGAALLFRDIGRLVANLFRSGEKVASRIERTNNKIDAVHDLVKDRADRQA